MRIRKLIKKLKRQLKKHLGVKRNKRRLYYIFSASLIFFLSFGLISSQVNSSNLYRAKQSKEASLRATYKALEAVKAQKASTEQEVQQKAASEAALKAQIEELNKQLQAKKEKQSLIAKSISVFAPARTAAVSGCGDNEYAHFIYMKESGCNPGAMNAGGCYGLGQDCNGIVMARCGADYQCQNEYFTSYVNGRYGGWQGAYSFWVQNHWY